MFQYTQANSASCPQGTRNGYQPVDSDAVQLESKGRYDSCLVASVA